jgi:hypothetical protein
MIHTKVLEIVSLGSGLSKARKLMLDIRHRFAAKPLSLQILCLYKG